MNPETTPQEVVPAAPKKHSVFTVTPLSKYLAMVLFIIMPFIGGWIGYQYGYSIEKTPIITIETTETKEVQLPVQKESDQPIEIFPEADSVTDAGNSMLLYENHTYGFSILYPDYVSLAEDIYDDAFTVASFSPNNSGHFAYLKIYKKTTGAQSFEQYSEELISKLKQQDAEKFEDTVEVPFSLYNEADVQWKYSFSIEEIGNFKVLRYKRNFLNIAGDSNDLYVWLGNGLTLEFGSVYDGIDSVDDTYKSLQKI